MQAVTTFTEN